MKTISVLLISCFLFVSCSKRDVSSETKQEEGQEMSGEKALIQEEINAYFTYVFDIDSFKFLDEFPRTIAGIKELYSDEDFRERVSENLGKGPSGKYVYSLDSRNIQFGFWGDNPEEANLLTVDILSPEYQCKSMQVIGMPVEGVEFVSGKKLTREGRIVISTDLYGLIIHTKDGFVRNYVIMEWL